MLKFFRDYFTLGFAAWIPAIIAAYGAISGGSGGGGGGGGGSGQPFYQPTDQPGADTAWQQMLATMTGAQGQQSSAILPYLMQAFGDSAGKYGELAGKMGGFGDTLTARAGDAYGGAAGLARAGSNLYQTSLDPQNALHDRTQHQVVEGARGADTARGIAMGPESAGTEGQTVSNFNIDWQNQQLMRQLQGVQGLSGAMDASGRQSQLGNADLTGAASMYQGAGALPFNLANMFSGSMNQGVYNPASGIMGQIIPYLNYGQGATQNAFGANQTNMNNWTSAAMSAANSPWLQNYFTPSSGGSGASSTVDNTTWGGA